MILKSDPATDLALVTPNDGADLADVSRGLYVGVSGNVKVTTKNGTTLVIPSLAAGIMHPFEIKRVWSTSTTATNIMVAY